MIRLGLVACTLSVGCASRSAGVVDASSDASGKSDDGTQSSPGRILRLLDGDAAIQPDGSATENGTTYPTVIDGAPQLPTIIADDQLGNVIAFAVPTDTTGNKQRIEYKIVRAADPDGLHFDNARYAGFAVQLPADPSPQPFLSSTIFWQAWQGSPFGPPISLKIMASDSPPYRVKLAIRNASVGPDSSVPDIELWSDAVMDVGTWHAFVIYVSPRFDGGSELKLWMDGTKLLDWQGAIGYDPSQVVGAYDGLDIKDGIYQPSANNGHTFLFDHIVVSTGFGAAALALGWQWPSS
jgi:hypothetical protein